jgi:RNA 3'-phosphate cyclase
MNREFEVELDGSQGEGGGQILRTTVSVAAILRKSLRIYNIRAGRPKPGLAAQHLTGINLIGEISEGSTLSGNEMKSTELSFVPGNIDGKDQKSYAADPHTAGSVTLMVQIALPCLLWSVVGGEGVRELELGGGTNVMASPPIEHLYFVLLPLLEGMIMVDEAGAGCSALTCEVHRTGWFPRGGGKVRLKVQGFKDLMPLVLTSREADETPSSVQVFVSSQIPESEWNGGVMDSLKSKLQSSMEELASSAIGAGAKVPEERDSPPNLEIVVNPFGNNSASALVGNRNHPSDHAKKRHRKEAGGGRRYSLETARLCTNYSGEVS